MSEEFGFTVLNTFDGPSEKTFCIVSMRRGVAKNGYAEIHEDLICSSLANDEVARVALLAFVNEYPGSAMRIQEEPYEPRVYRSTNPA